MTESAGTSDRSMEFCDFCIELVRLMAAPEDTSSNSRITLVKHPEISCNFCRRLMEELQRQVPDTFEPLNKSSQLISFIRSMRTWGTHTASYVKLVVQIGYPTQTRPYIPRSSTAKYALWVDRKTESKDKQFSGHAPILSPGIDEVRNQVRFWLNKCRSDHSNCPTNRVSNLPTRVLSLSGDLYGPTIRLMESKGTRGEYCALSHCWGPIDKRPLRTTNQNLQQHLSDIPYKKLPQTFQESVMLVLSLGIRYLWIDSLCILQDDRSDWQSEAKEMRNVYRNASLVIAASGAEDSSQGLFIQSRPHALVTKLPFDVHDETRGYLNATLIPKSGEDAPYRGVLNTRAWALQERYLARRFLAFMPGGISWACKNIKRDEFEQIIDREFRETDSWESMLESYTSLKLAFPADRLEALRGIVAEIQETRTEQFDFRYGVWKDTFHQDLLWVPGMHDSSSDLSNLPTWS
ncbi:heterokaryon incompatibility protein-domain-containing protein [Paraphoma chrysanthemicola]|uniref:Heterokaryon incompatibility protein-domain-containing protein n=1 Tax=Paraphoma chrysanthemicola TaxID=798071 RepID=A0A8K0RI14_9PLEO|nr:heterokaryon incompatibility protein-domain-containing protein [Paraphoma chrysanthemicola]